MLGVLKGMGNRFWDTVTWLVFVSLRLKLNSTVIDIDIMNLLQFPWPFLDAQRHENNTIKSSEKVRSLEIVSFYQ